VHALKPEAQLREVAARYALQDHRRPFTLCLHCNARLETVARSAVAGRVPDGILMRYNEFVRCPGCDRIYWQGSHWEHMHAMLKSMTSDQ
jgi:hypothetical protein